MRTQPSNARATLTLESEEYRYESPLLNFTEKVEIGINSYGKSNFNGY